MVTKINLEKRSPEWTSWAPHGIWIAAAAVVVALCAYVLFREPTPPPRQVTTADAYAAIFRALRADKACIDYSRNAMLVYISKSKKLKESETDPWQGWWYMPMPKFNYLPGNHTWFTEIIPDDSLTKIYPSSNGHKCADAKDFDGK